MKATKQQRTLMNLPREEFPEDIDFPAQSKVKDPQPWNKNYAYTCKNHAYLAERRGDLLIVTVYSHSGRMKWRLFQYPDKFFTQIPGRENPSEATLDTLDGWGTYNSFRPLRGADETVVAYLREHSVTSFRYDNRYEEKNVWKRLKGYQLFLREEKTKRRHDAIRKSINDDMLEIPDGLPKKVQGWLVQGPLKPNRYIIYTYKKGRQKMDGVCSHCGRKVQVAKPRHCQSGTCPNCHSQVTFIVSGKFKEFLNHAPFAYFQPLDSGYCIRVFTAHQEVKPNYHKTVKTKVWFHEEVRAFIETDHHCRMRFVWDNFQNTGSYEWCRADTWCSLREMSIYPNTLAQVAERYQELRYIPMKYLARHCGKLSPTKVLTIPMQYPWIEYLVKLKLYRLAGEIINQDYSANWEKVVNPDGRNLREILGVGKEAIPALQKLDVSVDLLKLYQGIAQKQGHVDAEAIRSIRWLEENMYDCTDILRVLHIPCAGHISRYIRYLEEQETVEWVRVNKGGGNYYIPHSWERPRTNQEIKTIIYRGIVSDWYDYLLECAQLEYDPTNTRIAFPPNLSEAHTRTSALIKVKKNEAHENAIRKRVPKLNRQYRFSSDGLQIRPPLGVEDLIAEGKALQHCVGGYAERHAKGNTTILFIRREDEPDTPYFTVEVQGDKLLQCRGLRNCAPSPEVDAFVQKWKRAKLVSKVTKRKESVRIAG